MDENNKILLKLENISKSFAKVENDEVTHALDCIDLEMRSGEFISLVGPSGCGKSTILRLVAGLIQPTLGKVTVNEKEITGPSPERGMVFQKPTLFPWLTVEKNIAFPLKMQGRLNDANGKEKVEHMLHVIGLEGFRDDYPGQLSGGMAQRVALVRTLISQPDKPFRCSIRHEYVYSLLLHGRKVSEFQNRQTAAPRVHPAPDFLPRRNPHPLPAISKNLPDK